MTIKAFGSLLKKYEDRNIVKKVHISHFKGHAVALDIRNIEITRFKAAFKTLINKVNPFSEHIQDYVLTQEFLKGVMNFFIDLIEAGITPVVVYDGEYSEAKKSHAHKRRQKDREKPYEEVKRLKELYKERPHSMSGAEIDKYRKALTIITYPTKQQSELFKRVIQTLGLKTYQGIGDGERLACALVREGICSAVWSQDYDCLAHGAHTIITGKKGFGFQDNERISMVRVISLPKLLKTLELNFQQFVEMCIISGCDVNDNIYRFGIGMAYKGIKTHGSYLKLYENIFVPDGKDVSVLNFDVAMEEFRTYPFHDLIESEGWEDMLTPEVDDEEIDHEPPTINKALLGQCRGILTNFGIPELIDPIIMAYKILPKPNIYERDRRFIYEGSLLPRKRRYIKKT